MLHVGHHWPNVHSSNSKSLLHSLTGGGGLRLPSARGVVLYGLLTMLYGPFFVSIVLVFLYRNAFGAPDSFFSAHLILASIVTLALGSGVLLVGWTLRAIARWKLRTILNLSEEEEKEMRQAFQARIRRHDAADA